MPRCKVCLDELRIDDKGEMYCRHRCDPALGSPTQRARHARKVQRERDRQATRQEEGGVLRPAELTPGLVAMSPHYARISQEAKARTARALGRAPVLTRNPEETTSP